VVSVTRIREEVEVADEGEADGGEGGGEGGAG
jgi:hypothetical protein